MIRECIPEDGWEGIALALTAAKSGDTVRLGPGCYAGSVALNVPGGVTLEGAGATLEHDGPGPAVQAIDADDVTLRGFTVLSRAQDVEGRRTPDGPVIPVEDEKTHPEWGIVWLTGGRGARVEGVEIVGVRGERWLYGLALRDTTEARVEGSTVRGCGGIGLTHDNRAGGIVLFSSEARIAGNHCWKNGNSGIILQRDSSNPEHPSTADLNDNRCHDNQYSGIVLISSEGKIAGNRCWQNGASGITLQRGSKSPEHPTTTGRAASCFFPPKRGLPEITAGITAPTESLSSGTPAAPNTLRKRM